MSLSWHCLMNLTALLVMMAWVDGSARAAERPTPQAGGRVLVLDNFTAGLDAWAVEGAAEGHLTIVADEASGRPALEWTLGDVGGRIVYRHMDRVKDFGRFNRVRLRVRAWDDEGRLGVGCAAKASMNISGWPKHLANRTPQWGLYDRDPEPSKEWRVLDEYLDFPAWYPWAETDNHPPGFWISASAGFSMNATMRIDEIALIDDAVEVHPDWGRMASQPDGGARWDYEVRLINRTAEPQQVTLEVAEPALKRFSAKILDPAVTLAPGASGVARVRVIIPAQVVAEAEPLYHEDLFVTVTPAAAPQTATTVRLPATVPLDLTSRPCLLYTRSQWDQRRAEFKAKDAKAQQRTLAAADALVDKPFELPSAYPVNRTITLVDGTQQTLPAVRSKKLWPRHLAAFRGVEALGEAWQLTRDRRYAQRAAEIVKAYAFGLDRFPLRGITAAREKGWARFAINNLHEGWLLMPMCYGYDMIRDAPDLFTPAEVDRIGRAFFIPMARSETPITSWFSNQTSVRYMAAALCGFNADDSNLVHFAVFGHAGLQRSIAASINPDGFMTEIPLNYHWANLIEMLKLAVVLENTGIDIPYRRDLLQKACRVPYLRAFPNGHVVGFGPHGYGRGPFYDPGKYRTAARLFDDPIFEQLADRRKGLEAIARQDSVLFPDTELIVLRQGTGPDQHAVNFLYGNKRRSHGASLAFTWYGAGELLAPALGSLYNVTHPKGAWVSPFYCQPNVDNHHQTASTGQLVFHRFGPGSQIASAQANDLFEGVEANRTVALHDGLLFVADRLASNRTHGYQWAYLTFGQLAPPEGLSGPPVTYQHEKLDLTGGTTDAIWQAEWKRPKLALRLTMLGGPATQVLTGDAYVAPGRDAERTPIVLARRQAKQAIFLAVLEPYAEGPRIAAVTPEKLPPGRDAAAMRVKTTGGHQYVFVVTYDGKPLAGDGWKVSDRAAVIEIK